MHRSGVRKRSGVVVRAGGVGGHGCYRIKLASIDDVVWYYAAEILISLDTLPAKGSMGPMVKYLIRQHQIDFALSSTNKAANVDIAQTE